MTIEFTAPIRIESEMNRREHWSARRKRFVMQKEEIVLAWPPPHTRREENIRLPCVVTLTRIGPRKLDSDNCASGFKAVRDQLAWFIGADDGDERIEWRYAQEKGAPKFYEIRIKIESSEEQSGEGSGLR